MKITTFRVRGLRSLRDATIPISPMTVFIGPNGSGKSSALMALRLFFTPQKELGEDDFWKARDGNRVDEVIISVTFSDLSDEAKDAFPDYISDDGDLTIERVFDTPGGGTYLASRIGTKEFGEVRRLIKGHRDRHNELADSGAFPGLGRARSKDEALDLMRGWERDHAERCERIEEEINFLALPHGQPTAVQSYVRGVFIGALEDPGSHVEARGRGAMADLLGAAADLEEVESGLGQIAERAGEEAAKVLSEQSDVFEEARRVVREAIGRFAPGFSIDFGWGTPRPVQPSLPQIVVSVLGADGLSLDLSHQGHGIQRSLMFSILTAHAEMGGAQGSRRILTTIEEPEAFQHPLSARSLARTFRKLTEGAYQILYSTHSPDLVVPSAVEGLRVFSRAPTDDGDGFHTVVKPFALSEMAAELQRAMGRDDFTQASTLARLEANLDPQVLEGLFAKLVVIVEGDEDEALIRGAAQAEDLDFDDLGVAVIRAHGKTSIPLVLAFFRTAGVDAYPVFDLDRNLDEEDWRAAMWAEDAIRCLLGLPVDQELSDSVVSEHFACWRDEFGLAVREEMGDTYSTREEQACGELGYRVKQGRKVGPVIQVVLRGCYEDGQRSGSLDGIIAVLRSRLE